jgi:hypothetical protein
MDRIRADIADHARAQALDAAVGRHAELTLDDFVPRLRAGEQVLAPVAHPFHGPACEPGQRAHGDFFGIERAFHTEAAPDVGGDHADLVRGQVQHIRQRITQQAGHLRRRPQRENARARVPFRQARAVLHRHARMTMESKGIADDDGGALDRGIDVALGERAREQHVRARLLVKDGAARLLARFDGRH